MFGKMKSSVFFLVDMASRTCRNRLRSSPGVVLLADPISSSNHTSTGAPPRAPRREAHLKSNPCWTPRRSISLNQLIEQSRRCATPCIEERLDHSPTGVDPSSDPPVGIRTEWTTLASGGRRLVCRKRPQSHTAGRDRRRQYRSPPRDDGRCGNIGRQARPSLGGWALRMSGLFLFYLSRPPPSSAPSGVLSRKDTLRYRTDCAAKTSAIPRQ